MTLSKKSEQSKTSTSRASIAVVIIVICALVAGVWTYANRWNISWQAPSYIETVSSTDVPAKTVLIFERKTCSDCQATLSSIDQTLLATLPSGVSVKYVDTTTDLGKQLVDTYGIAEVPSVAYIGQNEKNNYTAKAYTYDGNGNSVIDLAAIRNVVAAARADQKTN